MKSIFLCFISLLTIASKLVAKTCWFHAVESPLKLRRKDNKVGSNEQNKCIFFTLIKPAETTLKLCP